MEPAPFMENLRRSVPYVSGRIYEIGFNNKGKLSIGINKPQRNTIGKRKKLKKVWASNTSLTEIAMNKPKKVEVIEISTIPKIADNQSIPDISATNEANNIGTKALTIPNTIAPVVLASIRRLRLMGASNSLSKERLFLSKVIVTASIEVVPNRTDKAITPGKIPLIFKVLSDRMKNIRVQARGKIMPQLILGGLI